MSKTKATERAYPNVGEGADLYSLTDAFDGADRLVLLLQRDRFCQVCKRQTARFADRYDEFAERGAEVVVVVPDSKEKVQGWADDIEPPFPILADKDAALGDEYDQRVRFGVLGELHDAIGRMPEAVVLSYNGDDLEVEHVHRGGSYFDRPSVDDLLERVE